MADSSHSSNRETGEHERVIGIPETNMDSIIREWLECKFVGQTSNTRRKRIIQKVPAKLREDTRNKQEYDPAVVSFGPYHHENDKFRATEKLKIISLEMYVSECGDMSTKDLLDKVMEVVGDAKSCYVAGSTDAYTNEDFAQMMLLDGCLILNLTLWLGHRSSQQFIVCEHIGAWAIPYLYRDMFLLENQIPYQVLHVLMSIRFDGEQREEILNTVFKIFLSREWFEAKDFKVTIGKDKKQQPLHLLEIYRMAFLYKPGNGNLVTQPESKGVKKYIHSFHSARELKAKGIRFRRSNRKSITEIKFKSHYLYGHLKIPPLIITPYAKSTFLNLIAFEMCPNNPNDFGVTAYVRFMQSLLDHPDDVKELRTNNILFNLFVTDDEVVNMFKEINIVPVKLEEFDKLEESMQEYYNSKMKTWIAELISQHFTSPWTTIALLAAIFLLVLTFIQTLFTVHPKK